MSDTTSGVVGLVRFMRLAGRLKRTVRTGWVDRGIPAEQAESVADHSFRVALLSWLASARTELDRDRILKLALIHDLAEAITGDLTPYDLADVVVPDDDARIAFLNRRHLASADRAAAKRAAEAAANLEISRELPKSLRTEIRSLWQELEERATPEAMFVKQVDKLETYLQSLEYAEERPGLAVASFAAEVAEAIDVPELMLLRDTMRSMASEHEPPPSS
jgi:putative hydrolases of HD superfamily